MRRNSIVALALVASVIHSSCGSLEGALVTSPQTGILFINDSSRNIDIFIEGCDEFSLPARRNNAQSRYTARCESTENVLFTVRAFGEWVYRPGSPPVMKSHEHFATVRSGDTVYIRNSHSIFALDVDSRED